MYINLLHQAKPVDDETRAKSIIVRPVLVAEVGMVADGIAEPGLTLNPLDGKPVDGYRLQQTDIGGLRVAMCPHLLLASIGDACLIKFFPQNPFILQPNLTAYHYK